MLRAHNIDTLRHLYQQPYFASPDARTDADPFQPFEPSGLRYYDRATRASASERASIPNESHLLPQGPIEFGAVGDHVFAVQEALHAVGYLGNEPLDQYDERHIFGDRTMAALAT